MMEEIEKYQDIHRDSDYVIRLNRESARGLIEKSENNESEDHEPYTQYLSNSRILDIDQCDAVTTRPKATPMGRDMISFASTPQLKHVLTLEANTMKGLTMQKLADKRKSVMVPVSNLSQRLQYESKKAPILKVPSQRSNGGRRKSLNIVSVPSEFNEQMESDAVLTPAKTKLRHSVTMRGFGQNMMIQKMMKQNLLSRIVNVSEFQVVFKFNYFIKFLFYHILFFYMGPAASLPVLLLDSTQAVNNMSFWVTTKNKVSFIVQLIQWVACITILGSWIQKDFRLFKFLPEIHLRYIFLEQLYFFNMMVVLRAFIIAVRYGFFSRMRMNMLCKYKQEVEYIQ